MLDGKKYIGRKTKTDKNRSRFLNGDIDRFNKRDINVNRKKDRETDT